MIKKSKERLVVEALERIFGRTTKAIITDGLIIDCWNLLRYSQRKISLML